MYNRPEYDTSYDDLDWLTNCCAEESEFSTLTSDELNLLAEDFFEIAKGVYLHTGYSVTDMEYKYVALVTHITHDENNSSVMTKSEAEKKREFVHKVFAEVKSKLPTALTTGYDESYIGIPQGCFTEAILIPFSFALSVAKNFADWKLWLEKNLTSHITIDTK